MEVQPLLYQRPIRLSSQAKLFDWISRSRVQNLKQVRHLSLHLTDIDFSLSMSPDRSQPQQAPTAWSLYEDELSRFDTALRSLPGLTEITIIPPRTMHSQLLKGMYLSVLALIPRLHPALKLLIIHDDEAVLGAVMALQSLPKVVIKEPRVGSGSPEDRSRKALSAGYKSPRGRSSRVKVESEDW